MNITDKETTNQEDSNDTIFSLCRKDIIAIWHGRDHSRVVSGDRVIKELYSVEIYTTNTNESMQKIRQLALKVIPSITKLITETEEALKQNYLTLEAKVTALKNDPFHQNIKFGGTPTPKKQEIIISGKQVCPSVNLFIKTFLIIDLISDKLNELYKEGTIDFYAFKKEQKKLIKPIWRCMTQIDLVTRRFHEMKKTL